MQGYKYQVKCIFLRQTEICNLNHMLVVFDLDFTLWNCGGTYCDCTAPPYRKNGKQILDSDGSRLELYDDVHDILEFLKNDKLQLAIASRSTTPHWAGELLKIMGIDQYFNYLEIYPDTKTKHFSALATQSGISFSNMLFFDDEHLNIDEVGELGVNVVHVRNGINHSLFHSGLELLKMNCAYDTGRS